MSDLLNQPLFWLYFSYISLVIATLLHMLYQQRSPQNLMAWLLTLLLLPYLGVILYLFFGSRKFFKKRNKTLISIKSISDFQSGNTLAIETNKILCTNQIAGTTQDNHVQLFHNSQEAFSTFLAAIENATSSIYIETYILELDRTGNTILEALTEKAKQGLEVCLLLDGIGSCPLYRNRSSLKEFKKHGGKITFFNPVFRALFSGQINLRNHRKIYLFDQVTLFTGGMNLSNDYLGDSHSDQPHWKDLLFKIEGPATSHYLNIFKEDWLFATQQAIKTTAVSPSKQSNGTHQQVIQVVPSGPDIEGDPLFETLLHSFYSAKQQIQIITPYFIPDSAVLNALLIAIKRGVKVQLFTPETSDHLIFDLGRSSYMRELAEAGAEILYYTDNMLHAKLVMIDRQVMLSGSANLDYRSLFINHEVANFIYSDTLIKQTQNWIDQLKPNCIHYTPTPNRVRRLLENLTRIIAPIL
ncbi:MAG: cardiolipin synthase [Pseudomonadota bacterium]|nr:cardiolipin synthase [Pseudomonadota bacterium]